MGAEVAGLPRHRGCLAGVGVCEDVAGVVDVYGVLEHKGKQERYEEVRANEMDSKEQTEDRGRAYSRRS